MEINEFIEAVTKLKIKITQLQLSQLEEYYNLIVEYNKVMNLTGITIKKDVYLKHFYDSLTICNVINLENEETLCDIGTGAGFPGIVLKICFPNLKITLIDSLNKRIDFLNVVINKLELKNIVAIHSRAEEFALKNKEKFDVVTSRAVANLRVLLELCIPLVKVNKYFISMKANCEEEISDSKNALIKLSSKIESNYKFSLPIEKSTRTILKIKKIAQTPDLFPRKYSEIKKKPL